jgi:hypothetical protein
MKTKVSTKAPGAESLIVFNNSVEIIFNCVAQAVEEVWIVNRPSTIEIGSE